MYSLIETGKKPNKPKVKIGTKFHALYNTPNGLKMVNGRVILNDMIHFTTLEPLYTIETDDIDVIGRKIILEGVPESYFVDLNKI